jgi:hypothetical protein
MKTFHTLFRRTSTFPFITVFFHDCPLIWESGVGLK